MGGAAVAAPALGLAPSRPLARAFAQQATPAATPGTVSGDWPTFGYDYAQTRHVPFDQITKENVSDLGLAWTFDFRSVDPEIPAGNETFPIIVDGVLYATTSFNHVFALDAKTGEQLWHWAPENIGFFKNFGLNVNRGVAYGEGHVYELTLDMRVVKLDARTGELVQEIRLGDFVPDALPEYGYYETTAPIYYNGKLFVGSSGGDNGIRGFIMAFNASDLTPGWPAPFWTIPPEGQDWRSGGQFHGGGSVWMPSTIDTETDTLYFVTGNPSPDFFGEVRPGNNPNTNSIIAARIETGEVLWIKQSISRDLWDYDMAAPPVLMTATVGGERRKVVAEGSKAGQWWCWDAATGEVIYDGVPFATIDHPEPTEEGVLVSPGALGGSNYAPQSYDPTTNYYLICNVESPMFVRLATEEQIERRGRGDIDFGAIFEVPADVDPHGTYVAIDMNTGEVVYSREVPGSLRGGFTTTTTGLGFFGGTQEDPNLHAIDTSTGDILWSFGVGADVFAAPSIYMVDDEEYVAVAVGGGGTGGPTTTSKMVVFKLGGDKTEIASATPVTTTVEVEQPTDPAQFLVLAPDLSQTVIFNCVAAYSPERNGMNFNGYSDGDMTITIPLGWALLVNFWNASGQMPHAAMLSDESELDKPSGHVPAYVGTNTPEPETGYVGQGMQTFESGPVKLSTEGTYVILCPVPGHVSQGMWDYLIVDPNATVPTLTAPDLGTIEAQ